MDPDLKKIIEKNKQEALRKQEIFKEQLRIQLQNQAKNKLPVINKHPSVVNNQRYAPYSKSNSSGQSSVLQNYNNKTFTPSTTTSSPYKQSNIANYLVPKSPTLNQATKLPASSSSAVVPGYQAKTISTSSSSSNRKLKATFSLISESRFQVRCDYDQQVIDEFKKMPTKSFSKLLL